MFSLYLCLMSRCGLSWYIRLGFCTYISSSDIVCFISLASVLLLLLCEHLSRILSSARLYLPSELTLGEPLILYFVLEVNVQLLKAEPLVLPSTPN